MLISILRLALLGAVCCTFASVHAAEDSMKFHPTLDSFVSARTAEFDQIPAQRQALLKQLARYIRENSAGGKPVRLTFICTHNSRRSHLAQIWASVAAQHNGMIQIETYSGGTEATAFNPRAVAAVQRAGLEVVKKSEGANPHYQVRMSPQGDALTCFSKRFDSPPNPAGDFCAVLTCSQ
ncbi:MAG: protein-tyrosine-phosphatase, partial [Planctomycetes bacterium]|nr:protein-tyrosine-phosphatase [Planctomycetota bacterium]